MPPNQLPYISSATDDRTNFWPPQPPCRDPLWGLARVNVAVFGGIFLASLQPLVSLKKMKTRRQGVLVPGLGGHNPIGLSVSLDIEKKKGKLR